MSSNTTSRSNSSASTGKPYLPGTHFPGGFPTETVDIPIASVFIFLLLIGATIHISLLLRNLRRKHKFYVSAMLASFCMARTVTMCMRIAWAANRNNARVALAAEIFVSAGVLLLFATNIIFAQRLLRAYVPKFGWNWFVTLGFAFAFFTLPATLSILVTSIVQIYHTRSRSIIAIDRSLQHFGVTYFLVLCVLPLFVIAMILLLPHMDKATDFGKGSKYRKLAVLGLGTSILTIGAAWRTSNVWREAVPLTRPMPWYLSRASFWVFNFTLEVLVVYLYAAVRVDRLFYVPDGTKGPGSYGVPKDRNGTGSTSGEEEEKRPQQAMIG